MSTPQLLLGQGPRILLPNGKLGALSAKFPDKGVWPFFWPMEAYAIDMGHMAAAVGLAKYAVFLFDPVAEPNGIPFVANPSTLHWPIPAELLQDCVVPTLIASITPTTGSNIWYPLNLYPNTMNITVGVKLGESAVGGPEIFATSTQAAPCIKIVALFLPFKSGDFVNGGHDYPR